MVENVLKKGTWKLNDVNLYVMKCMENQAIIVTGISSREDMESLKDAFDPMSGKGRVTDVKFDPFFGLAIITFNEPGGNNFI